MGFYTDVKLPKLSLPRKLNVAIQTSGETVTENEVSIKKESVVGSAVDVLTEEDALDMYLVLIDNGHKPKDIPAPEEPGSLTGAVTAENENEFNEYTLELTISKQGEEEQDSSHLPGKFFLGEMWKNTLTAKNTKFVDLYGPYKVKKGEGFIFAQKLQYDIEKFHGPHTVRTKLLKEGQVVVENEFEVELQ